MLRVVRVAGDSMAPTYRPADLLLTARVGGAGVGRDVAGARRAGRPARRGDVVVLRHDGGRVLKRLLAGPGDLVELEAGRLSVNGRPVDGRPHVRGAATRRWQVPEGRWFVAGDNAAASDDSRVWREPFVPDADVLARVTGRLLPFRPRRPPAEPPDRPPPTRRRPAPAGAPAA